MHPPDGPPHPRRLARASRAACAAALSCAAAIAGVAGACGARPETPFEFFADMVPERGGAPVRVEFGLSDRDIVGDVLAALREAYPEATRWGSFRTEVRVRVYPSHEALETELGRKHLDWLRAWATFDSVLLQSPRTWGGDERDYPKRLGELLKHELCHVAVYQVVATKDTWEHVDLPLWFREGLASYTAGQEYRRGEPWKVGRRLLEEPELDPLFSPDGLLMADQDLVYAAAHWAFVRLLERHGEAGVRKILSGVASGLDFHRAFDIATGASPRTFGERWRADVELLARARAEATAAGTAGD